MWSAFKTKDPEAIPLLNKEIFHEWGEFLTNDLQYDVAIAEKYLDSFSHSDQTHAFVIKCAKPAQKGKDQTVWNKDQDFPVGVVFIGEPPELIIREIKQKLLADDELELFVWIRGPYRTLGIGRECLGKILEEILKNFETQNPKIKYFVVRFPNVGRSFGDRYLQANWSLFFHDFDFKSYVSDQQSRESKREIRLRRKIPPSKPSVR